MSQIRQRRKSRRLDTLTYIWEEDICGHSVRATYDRPRRSNITEGVYSSDDRLAQGGSLLYTPFGTYITGASPHGHLSLFFGEGLIQSAPHCDVLPTGGARLPIWKAEPQGELAYSVEIFCEKEREASSKSGSLRFVEPCCSVVQDTIVSETAAT